MSATLWLVGSAELSQLRLLRPHRQDQLVLCGRAAEAVAWADQAAKPGNGEALVVLEGLGCQVWALQREEASGPGSPEAEDGGVSAQRGQADPNAATAGIPPITPAQLVQMACDAARVVSL